MEKNAVNWFEIPVSDMARAKSFYSKVFDKDLQDMPNPNMEMAAFPWTQGAEFAAGALIKSEQASPSAEGSTVYFSCEDLSNELSRVEASGGKILYPKSSIGEHGFIAQVLDTEGNKIGLHSAN